MRPPVLKYLALLLLCPLPVVALSLSVTPSPTRVAVPANGPTLDSAVSSTFSRGRYFIIFDLAAQRRMVRENPYWNDSRALGLRSTSELLDARVGAVIVNRIGPAPLSALQARGVRVVTGSPRTVQEALDLYRGGQLSELEPVRVPGAAGRGQGPRWARVPMNAAGAAQGAALSAPAAPGVTEL